MIDALAAVLKAKIGLPRLKPTLCALADVAQPDEGEWCTFASIRWLAEVTERGESTVRADLVQLEGAGWISRRRVVEPGRQRLDAYTEYVLNRERIEAAENPWLRKGKPSTNWRRRSAAKPPSSENGTALKSSGDRTPGPALKASATCAEVQRDHRQGSAAHIDERDLELEREPCRAPAFDEATAHGVRDPLPSATAETSFGLAGEWVAVPPQLRARVLSEANRDESWAQSYFDRCGINVREGMIHPATGVARGQLLEPSVRMTLSGAGFTIGEAIPLAKMLRAIAAGQEGGA